MMQKVVKYAVKFRIRKEEWPATSSYYEFSSLWNASIACPRWHTRAIVPGKKVRCKL